MQFVTLRTFAPVLVASTLILEACGGGSSPSAPNTPSPSPTTTPAAVVAPRPARTSCDSLGYTSGVGNRCPTETPTFLVEVDRAIDRLAAEHPEIFDFNVQVGAGAYRVKSPGAYYVGVIKNLDQAGLCAGFDGEELQVTNTKDYSDQYHILTSGGFARRGSGSYRVTCYPAAFPTAPPPFAPSNGCALPSSHEIACGREESRYPGHVDEAVDEVAKAHPEYFDFKDLQQGTPWYKVLNTDGYIDAMNEAMKKKGYCARWDGEELVVKNSNERTEHYDILTGLNYIRRGGGSYRASCYPAAF
jgi:hypothetical protein